MVAEVLSRLKIYQAICWPLFPCSEKDKSPLTPHGFKDASLDPSVIAAWAEKFPGCAWGVPTTAERAVLDIDPRNGGNESLERLVAEHGDLPDTPMTATGGGGLHFWLSFPAGTRCGKLAPGIDRKAIGGYVIVPPSRILIPEHEGRPYRFLAKPWEMEIAAAPPVLSSLDPVKTAKADRVGGVPPADVRTPMSAWVVGQPLDFRTHPGGKRGELWGLLTRMLGAHLGSDDHPDDIRRWAEEWISRSEQWDETPDWWRGHVEGMIKRERQKREAAASARQHLPALSPPAVPVGVGSPEETGSEETISSPPSATAELVSSRGVPSDPIPDAGPETGEGEGEGGCSAKATGITLHPDAYHGLLGGMLNAVADRTEAHAPAIAVTFITAFGNAVGLKPYWDHGKPHGANMSTLVVGPTTARKGTALAVGSHTVRQADPAWGERVCDEGFGSGEGVVWAVRDEVKTTKVNKAGQPEEFVQPGVDDKRLLVVEEEMAKALRLAKTKESILAAIIRQAFDRVPIGKLNKGEARYRCSKPHISIIGNITKEELLAELQGTSHLANGFINRFLICETRREKFIPRKGRWRDALAPFERPVADALAFAKNVGLVELDDEAGAVWDGLYEGLETRPDDVFGKATSRASDYVMKLALVYALLDRDDAIRLPHLKAALAVWRYCEASAASLFGASVGGVQTPDPLWLSALNLIRSRPGVGRGDIVYALRHAAKADAVGKALEALRVKGLAYAVSVQPEGGGRPKEEWHPAHASGEQGVVNNDSSPAPSRSPLSVSGSWVVGSEETNSEETNSLTRAVEPELVPSQRVSSDALPDPRPRPDIAASAAPAPHNAIPVEPDDDFTFEDALRELEENM